MEFPTKVTILVTALFIAKMYAKRPIFDFPEIPEKCQGTHEIMDALCCIFPPFFAGEIAKECGTYFTLQYHHPHLNVSGYTRKGITCPGWKCILSRYNLLVGGYVDEKKFYRHLDRWVKLNTDFREAIFKAKVVCSEFRSPFPIEGCKYSDYHNCLRNYVNMDCPVMIDSNICMKQKKFYDECRQYFV